MFNLKRGASLQQIKVAYRNAVKTCHPDLNPNAGPEETARFITLTKTYERLLTLHAQQTGER
jgi:DnaJ-class molecular chaperone